MKTLKRQNQLQSTDSTKIGRRLYDTKRTEYLSMQC